MKTLTISIIILFAISLPLFSGGKKESKIEPENSMMMVGDNQNNELDPFINYQNFEQAKMIAQEAPTVLFFYASWCPTCRSAREEFIKRDNEIKKINIILVDYDNSKELQNKYGVTYQHTFVQIDKNGEAINKWNGGATDKLLSNIRMEDDS